MDDRIRGFIANESWLLVAILTFALVSIVGVAGLGALASAISIVGWFLLTPILLFWGEEVALLLEEDEATDATRDAETDAESDPLEELKRRYAAGEIDDAEFERRLERLVAVDDIPDDAIGSGSGDETTDTAIVDETRDDTTRTEPLERDREPARERKREREQERDR